MWTAGLVVMVQWNLSCVHGCFRLGVFYRGYQKQLYKLSCLFWIAGRRYLMLISFGSQSLSQLKTAICPERRCVGQESARAA